MQRYARTVSIVLLLATTTLVAQNQVRSGTVSDAQGSLAGVNVLVKNTHRGTITSMEGAFTIQAKPTDSLVFSFVGYLPQTIPVGKRTSINVTLVQDATALDQVVLNAGYYNVTDREKTGSIAKVTAQEIANQPVTNPLAALQGRMPGVNVVQNTGVPGGGFSIRIRGRNSIRADGSEPLYIIDGVPYAAQSLGDYTVSPVLGGAQSPLNTLDPNSIESIEVLKDADATAIYGSRGANGVVLITTKKGKAGKTTFSINSSTGVGSLTRTMKLLHTKQYLAMRREAFANDGITEFPFNAYDVNGTWSQTRYTDWQEELLGNTAYYHATDATLQGGSEQTRFLLSGRHQKQTTVFPGTSNYKRNTVLLNLDHTTADNKVNISFSGNYGVDANTLPPTNLVREALVLPPNAPALYNEDGSLNWEEGTFTNPLAALEGEYRSHTNSLIANSVLTYRPFKNLELKANMGYVHTQLDETKTSPHTIYNPAFGLDSSFSAITLNNGERTSWVVEPQIGYKLSLGKGQLTLLAGSTFQKQTTTRLLQFASDFPSNKLIYNPAAAATVSINDNSEEVYKYQAGFARANFNWDHTYIVNLTGRRDGSSRFGPNNQYATFGAVGLAWIFSEEQFIQEKIPFLSFGKLRSSYGTSGNDQIRNYGFLDTYSPTGFSYQGMQGLSPVQLYNPNYRWETNKKWEAALELGFLKDRISVATSYYRNRSSNQLVGIPLPGTTGFTSLNDNLDATVQNTGWEFELATTPVQNKKLQWQTAFNISIPKNKLVSFPGLEASTYANQYVVGQPLDIRLLYQATGVDPQTGVYTFQDVDGDGQITTPNDRTTVVNVNPKYYGGVRSSLSYGNINFDFLLQFVKQKGTNFKAAFSLPGFMENQPVEVLDHWQQPGDQSSQQVYSTGFNGEAYTAYNNLYYSTGSVSDASYIRVKNIALSYSIPQKWALGIGCRVYLQAQNLFTFTKYKGPDPETQINNNLPPLKVINTGVQLTF
ncbi:MAG: SusC/RagA family protein [Flavobacteriaceae bacterium]|nr:SusC/RagA family protein [Flavobacteriaceae bacterium]